MYKGGNVGVFPFSVSCSNYIHLFGERAGKRCRCFARQTTEAVIGGFVSSLCIRRLTMLQLASTCEAMGIPKDTVKDLRRWDRVHMIKELAGVAVRFQ